MATSTRKPTYDELLALEKTMQAENATLKVCVAEQNKSIAAQGKRIAELERQLAAANKNSSNSSKPPSSDITKPLTKHAKPGRPKKRKIGGQKGHPKHDSDLTLDDADHVVEYHADQFVDSKARSLVAAHDQAPKIIFQYEFVDKPMALTAYVSYPYQDRSTDEIIYAPFPQEIVAAGIMGARLTAFAACLKGGVHASYSGAEKVLSFLGVDVCRATISNKIKKVSAALAFAHDELLGTLPTEAHLNIDETGHQDHPFEKTIDHKKH